MARAAHLARRFAGSLVPLGPSASGAAWAEAQLTDGERGLWQRMSRVDRRHAVGVARRVERALGSDATRPVLAAALLHDVGKVASRLGTFGRVGATLAGAVAGHAYAHPWSTRSGVTRRFGLYLRHAELGGDMLELAGADALTVAWTRHHHDPEGEWTVPLDVGRALKVADDD